MVQLKYVSDIEVSGESRFNSCMVQLKFWETDFADKYEDCFNSCMVQLKCPADDLRTDAVKAF